LDIFTNLYVKYNATLNNTGVFLNIKIIFGALLIFTSSTLSYPKISSADWCQPKHCKTTVGYCAIKSDSLREGEVTLSINSLRAQNEFSGTMRPDKNGMKYRSLKPECMDPQMVRIPDSEIQMQ
jgi:hypothetical protein